MDLAYESATALTRLVRQRELGSEELLDVLLARVEHYNPALNALVHLDWDGARRRAREADAALARGEVWGPLHGLPMSIKETYEVAGMPTTAGAPKLREHMSSANAVVAQRLLDAGAILIGKSNVPLYSGDLQTYNEIYGCTNNPWNLARVPGGSSGGGAAALAAGLTPLEFGSDIGGSIRIPAGFCGVMGHKPSYGLVSHEGLVSSEPGRLTRPDINVMGPLARSVEDVELALDLCAGPSAEQGRAWRLELPAARGEAPADYRVATWLNDAACPVEAETETLLREAADRLRQAGARVEDARPAGVELSESHALYYDLLTAAVSSRLPDKALAQQAAVAGQCDPDDQSYMARFARAASQTHAQWLRQHERRLQLGRRWAEFFRDFDVLLCPVSHTLPFPHDHSSPVYERQLPVNGAARPYLDILTWVGLSGLVYLPSTVVPLGLSESGLPVGIQVVGPCLEDRTCLDVARHLEGLLGGFRRPPGY